MKPPFAWAPHMLGLVQLCLGRGAENPDVKPAGQVAACHMNATRCPENSDKLRLHPQPVLITHGDMLRFCDALTGAIKFAGLFVVR